MRKTIGLVSAGVVLQLGMVGLSAIADEGFSPEDLVEATRASLGVMKSANPSHIEHVTGFKTWKSGVDAKVKFYVAHDGMTMEYVYGCSKQGSQLHCVPVQ